MRYLGPSISPEAALRDLGSDSLRVRVEAAEALGRVDPGEAQRACAALRPLLDDDSPDVRYATALSLGRLEDRGSVDRLMRMLAEDPESMPRQAAAVALGDIGAPQAAPALARALFDAPADVRFQAASALPLVDPAAAVEPLRRALQDADAEVRATAAAALGDLRDDGSRDTLARLVEDPDIRVRMEAAMALARQGDRRGTPELTAALDHRDFGPLAAEHLFRCPDKLAAPSLHRALERWLTAPTVKVWAAGALARLGERGGREQLLHQLNSSKELVRGLTIQVLGEMGQPWSRKALRSLLERPASADWERWRFEILQALEGRADEPSETAG